MTRERDDDERERERERERVTPRTMYYVHRTIYYEYKRYISYDVL